MTIPDMKKLSEVFPAFVSKYETFTLDDDSNTLNKMNDLVQQMNRLGRVSNETVKQWNQVMAWVLDEGVNEATNAEIQKKFDDGTFDEMISLSLDSFKEETITQVEAVNVQLAEKATKGEIVASDFKLSSDADKLKLINLSDEVKQAMAGTTPVNATPPNDGVTSEKVALKALDKHHLNFIPLEGVAGKNLINKNDLTVGKYVQHHTGNLADNASWSSTKYLPIKAGLTYTINFGDQLAFYDVNYVYLSGLDFGTTNNVPNTFTVPVNSRYVRLGIPNAKVATAQLELGSSATTYEDFGNYKLSTKTKVTGSNMDDRVLPVEKLDKFDELVLLQRGKNLFDKSKVTSGKYVRWDFGTLGDNTSYSVSDFTDVLPSTEYVTNYGDQIAYFDGNKTYISGIQLFGTSAPYKFTTPSGAKFIRMSIPNTQLNVFQLEKGTVSTSYQSFKKEIAAEYLPTALKEKKTIHQIISPIVLAGSTKRVKLIGDSITHGVGGTGFAQTGEVIYSTFQVNENGVCWANKLKSYWESKFPCVVKNFGTTGRNSYDLLQNISTIVKSDDDIVICMIGTNDRNNEQRAGVTNSKTTYYNNLKGIVEYVQGAGKEIILMSSVPASVTNENSDKIFHMEDVDHVAMKVASEYGMEYISLYKLFTDYCERKNITIDSLLADGLHPNDVGYDVMFNLVTNRCGISLKRTGATW